MGPEGDGGSRAGHEQALKGLAATGAELVRFEPDWPDIREAFRMTTAGAGNATARCRQTGRK